MIHVQLPVLRLFELSTSWRTGKGQALAYHQSVCTACSYAGAPLVYLGPLITHAYRHRFKKKTNFLSAYAIECCRSGPVRHSWLAAASSEHPKAQMPSTNVAFTVGRLSLLPCNLCSKLPSNTVKSALIPTLHAKQKSHTSHSSFVWAFWTPTGLRSELGDGI